MRISSSTVGSPGDLLELVKARIVLMVVVTVAAGYWMAGPPAPEALTLFHLLLGTAMVAAGTNALNQVAEWEVDRLMRRTRGRPIPAGRLKRSSARNFAWVVGVCGVVYLWASIGLLVSALAGLTLVSYVFVYTPLKRRTSLATLIGAVPGALPIAGGWAAATGSLSLGAWILFWILFLWQLPHFLALGWLYREDYARADLKLLGIHDPGGRRTFAYATLYAAALLPVSLLPAMLGMSGPAYFVGALLLSGVFLGVNAAAARSSTALNARRAFQMSLAYLPALLVMMVATSRV